MLLRYPKEIATPPFIDSLFLCYKLTAFKRHKTGRASLLPAVRLCVPALASMERVCVTLKGRQWDGVWRHTFEAIEKRSKISSSATLEAAGMSCHCQGSREAGSHRHTPALP